MKKSEERISLFSALALSDSLTIQVDSLNAVGFLR